MLPGHSEPILLTMIGYYGRAWAIRYSKNLFFQVVYEKIFQKSDFTFDFHVFRDKADSKRIQIDPAHLRWTLRESLPELRREVRLDAVRGL